MASSTASGTYDIGIDLGTANTLVYARGKGVVLNEPSVVAVNATGDVVAVGLDAKRTLGRTPSGITTMRPLRDGVIADFDAAEQMLRALMRKALPARRFAKPRVVVCVPSGVTGVERYAVVESVKGAGAREVHLVEEPMAAAIGAGLPVEEPYGCMVVDIGGGTTEVAVLSMGGIVTAQSVRTGGDALDAAVLAHVKKKHSLLIGEASAEDIKKAVGSAAWTPVAADEDGAPERPTTYTVRGRDNVSGLPRIQELAEDEVREALAEPVEIIVGAVRRVLDECPPELAGDIYERGIHLTGGGALLRGLDLRLRQETGVPVTVAEEPLDCVVRGAARCVEEFETLHALMTGAAAPVRRPARL
ncbi:rod shape-determining protein [Streptomyces sp. NPDC059740]|uniref:rod shape-determining protein n=1 Tax=Streptomyces sp. NPDC059740 TaxID=3346926 RepID=UPI00366092C3